MPLVPEIWVNANVPYMDKVAGAELGTMQNKPVSYWNDSVLDCSGALYKGSRVSAE